MMRLVALIILSLLASMSASASASFEGPFGVYDRDALQRGFHLYAGRCTGCAALEGLRYGDLGRLGFNSDEIRVIARDLEDLPEDEMVTLETRPLPVRGKADATANPLPPGLLAATRQRGPRGAAEMLEGTPELSAAEASDIAAFLVWVDDPQMELRKKAGLAVTIYLLILTAVLFALDRGLTRFSRPPINPDPGGYPK